jgi:hypothetical protein
VSWYILHNNAPANFSGVSKFLVKWGIPMLSNPPYNQFSVFFLFPK